MWARKIFNYIKAFYKRSLLLNKQSQSNIRQDKSNDQKKALFYESEISISQFICFNKNSRKKSNIETGRFPDKGGDENNNP